MREVVGDVERGVSATREGGLGSVCARRVGPSPNFGGWGSCLGGEAATFGVLIMTRGPESHLSLCLYRYFCVRIY